MMLYSYFKRSFRKWVFVAIVGGFYGLGWFLRPEKAVSAFYSSVGIFRNILPVFVLVFALMGVTNYFVKPKKLLNYFGSHRSVKGWIIASLAGIISHGPIFMWYPWLSDLQEKGVGNGFIATFLYNRAVKVPLIPFMALYFGIDFVAVLTLVMIVFSLFQGVLVGKLLENKGGD
ncbi:MAG: hypothetical protein MUP58_00250 [Candidatus Nanohaloarchaeota archaeon QJJ-9]|nr:hypothetical protein [Candidatus Nanohaloarchaeota archaeon QJJ-9]